MSPPPPPRPPNKKTQTRLFYWLKNKRHNDFSVFVLTFYDECSISLTLLSYVFHVVMDNVWPPFTNMLKIWLILHHQSASHNSQLTLSILEHLSLKVLKTALGDESIKCWPWYRNKTSPLKQRDLLVIKGILRRLACIVIKYWCS